jgi:competence protein ComEC
VSAAVVVTVLPIRVIAPGWPPPGWILVGCDVGQGDALALRVGPGAAVVIDAGPDPTLVDACLSRLGVRHVPLLLLSHFHLDHVGGIAGVLRGRTVDAIGVGGFDEPAEGVAAVRATHVPMTELSVGESLTIGEVSLQVLGPLQELHGTRSDPNNNSLIVRAVVASVSILLPGDAEHDAERSLLSAGAPLAADVLKVPHHGSAWSEPAFLDAAAARVAIVEVGIDNDYGHPSPGVIAHLSRSGARVLRTDLDGDVAVIANAKGVGRPALSTAERGPPGPGR